MSFIDSFRKISILKPRTFSKSVDSFPEYNNAITNEITSQLKLKIGLDEIIVRPSIGKGNYADIAWICLLSSNPSISPSPQKGLYIVLLFNKLGNTFYLALSQGITNFNNMDLKSKQRDVIIENTVRYFQNELAKEFIKKYGFSMDKMNLGDNISSLAKGYIKTTIISKRYDIDSFDEDDFYSSLSALLIEYIDIIEHIAGKSYDDVIGLINPSTSIESLDSAIEKLDEVFKGDFTESRDMERKPQRVMKGSLRPNKYEQLTKERVSKKIDYIQQAREQYQTGLKGELLVLKLERTRLMELNLDPDQYIKWSSSESDSYGYDIESVEYRNGKLTPIYIEVKSSKDIKDTSFYFSKNEIEVSKIKKEQYRVFRIFDIRSMYPKYYVVDGEIEESFYLDPITFSARYKFDLIV